MSKNWQDYSAMTAALAVGADDVLFRDKSDTTDSGTEGSVKRLAYEALLAASGLTPGGRLTLESGVPVSSTDQTAKGTLYYTPYVHDYVRLYDGTRPKLYTFTELSLSLTLTSGKNYDVFLYDNAGTLTLELSAAWTNDTTRADALAWQSGVGYVKSGTATRLWLGTIRASASNQCTDSQSIRYVWNAFNRLSRPVLVFDSTDSWAYTTNAWRQANAAAANKIQVVTGLAGSTISLRLLAFSNCTHSSTIGRVVGIGRDSTTSYGGTAGFTQGNLVGDILQAMAMFDDPVTLGYHYYSWNEYGGTAVTFYGDLGLPSAIQAGLTGVYEC